MESFLRANFHTHTYRCQHAYGTEEEFVLAAIEMGIKQLGFSDHIPCPFTDGFVSRIRMRMSEASDYVESIRALGRKYKGRIQIYVGFEAEYIPEFYESQMAMFRLLECDYLIMGQHFLESERTGPYMGQPTDDEKRIRAYVDLIIEGMETGSYRCLAHPDLMNYQGLDSVYEWEMTRLCQRMKELNIPLELNILGMGTGRHYPAGRFWKLAGAVGNDVIMGLDAHSISHLQDVESYRKCLGLAEKYNLHLINSIM